MAALQIVRHVDVFEDFRRKRVYHPATDRRISPIRRVELALAVNVDGDT
jgi:hypothetical protein